MFRNEYDPIVFSDQIKAVLDTFRSLQQTHDDAKTRQLQSEKGTQDLLHTIELYTLNDSENNQMSAGLNKLRRIRRVAKNEDAILNPVVTWINANRSVLDSLNSLYESMRIVEDKINGPKVYYPKTDIVESLLGKDSNIVKEQTENTLSAIPVETPPQDTVIKYSLIRDNDEQVRSEFQYPVVLYYATRTRKNNMYYFAFPGVESPVKLHTFGTGDPCMNIHNKRLRDKIRQTLKDVLFRTKRDLPIPVNVETLYPKDIGDKLRIPKHAESRIILQNMTVYHDPESKTL